MGKDGRMSLQCAPCLSDLALVREAVTSVGGTATCTAHAVLLRHPSDDPQRRRRRLADLRTLAEQRVADATGNEKERLELLVQEYAVAEAMDLGAPDRTGPGRGSERGRRGRGERGDRPERGERGERGERRPGESREGRPDRGRGRGRDGASAEGAPAEGAAAEGAAAGAPATPPDEAEIAAPVIESVLATESAPGEAAPATTPEPAPEPARDDSASSSPDPEAS
jgi:hypothetical protein